jgi:tetratricopeptide (TPR) repeat protein
MEIKPDCAKGYFNLGCVYYRQGKLEEAIASFQQALKMEPNHAEAHYNLGVIYYAKHEFKLAVQHLDEAVKFGKNVDPNFLERLSSYR